ncbi:hypothetical protein AYI74_14265 [Shewanella algae]|uniref:DNA polymerase III subunit psi n=1 Tax=Shewanella TaxID=22 RepID=UPI000D14F1CA|nr:DNA polymerase III subunit psi [Shewanella algae]MBO2611013.1 DNA polymerase III subunit psi [Shewanella algae]MBO2661460.1 DNA polymerase III subunit psi [Shewanella algae]MCL1054457.1 DNA polymerase III subunit psi [Shewanella algae]PST65867.1 hypothetical protein AYI77_16935 [Shewanella algae]TVO90167.1 hypothetical protein AYI80_10020 [Shewanella algae]
MNKYLHAMGIELWRSRQDSPSQVPFMLLVPDADESVLQHPLVLKVLTLLGLEAGQCSVGNRPVAGQEVIWNMFPEPVEGAWLNSSQPAQLMSGSEGKRGLWQQIWHRLEAK